MVAQANVELDEKGRIVPDLVQRAPGRQLRAQAARRNRVHRRQPEAAGLGGRQPDSVPRERRRQPRADGIEHAAPGRAAAARRRSLRGHRHGARDGARFGRGGAVQALRRGGFGGFRAHHRARGRRRPRRPAFARSGRRHLPAHQVQALQPEHLHQPEADRRGGAARGEGPGAGRRPLHRHGRTGAGPQRAGGLHALARVQLRRRHPGQREAGQGRLLHLDPHRGVRNRGARHQAGARGNHARHSQHRRFVPAQPGRKRHHPHRRHGEAGRHPGGQGDAQGRNPAHARRETAARHLRRKGRRREGRLALLPAGHRRHHRRLQDLLAQGAGEGRALQVHRGIADRSACSATCRTKSAF